ncbi:hypothetical protein [Caballeronia sp. ATUFL_F2_KS9A]|uniref:T6SS effector phospholipase Tle3 domain-containing protein n=2 Tax=unclassified Caballeronia TaxID=2646786 RepID=UPI0020280E9E|nr:hypothetical protein [Caballeronia sp. ATUFL_F2_KS9A]
MFERDKRYTDLGNRGGLKRRSLISTLIAPKGCHSAGCDTIFPLVEHAHAKKNEHAELGESSRTEQKLNEKMTGRDTPDQREGAASDDAQPKRYKLETATCVVPMQADVFGRPFWESYMTPESYQVYAECRVPPALPGVVIFVHGVNSEGEWYEAAEKALCEGLNARLGRKDLKSNDYTTSDGKGGVSVRRIANGGYSPVIRFYWGYRAQEGKEHKWRVPLKNIRDEDGWKTRDLKDSGPWFWGGGPFQNGTNNLQQLWSETGFSPRIAKVFNLQWFNTEWDRELHDAPGRQYYAHAAQRLANLIDKIRTRCPDDTITVMSHSQGTMISMAATLMCKTRAPDSLVVMNSPFSLEDKSTDALTCWHSRPTTQARVNTFRNVAERIKKDKKVFTDEEHGMLHVGATQEMELWHVNAVNNGIKERDNHGRLYVYFNPHDRVMGSKALQSIGWRGVSDALIDELGDTVKQRMLARGTSCGDAPATTNFGTLPPIPNPEPGVKPGDFWNGNRTAAGVELWTVPGKNQKVNINAEQVPHPITAEEMSKKQQRIVTRVQAGQTVESKQPVERYFEEALSDQDALGAKDKRGNYLDPGVPYLESIHRLEKQVMNDPYAQGPLMRTENHAEMIKRIEEYQPMPTNHSTLPQHHEFMSRVVAWDLPIGFCESHDSLDFWLSLIKDADWTQIGDEYFDKGTLNVPPIPKGIDPETITDEIVAAEAERQKINKPVYEQ